MWRSTFSRTASRTSRVVRTPISAESSAVSSCFSSAGSIFLPPRKIPSTRAAICERVLLTDSFSRSSSEADGFSSADFFFPKIENIRKRTCWNRVCNCSRTGNCGRNLAGLAPSGLQNLRFERDFYRREANFPLLYGCFQCIYNQRIEFCAGKFANQGHREFQILTGLIRTIGGHRV